VPKLVIFRGDSVESELQLRRQTVRIGRDTRNDVVLDDKTVTRFHAEVTHEGGTYYVSDLDSRNGVWINNQRIKGKTPLALGVPVTVGAYEVTLEDDVGTSDLSDLVPGAGRTVISTQMVPAAERSSASTARGRAAAPPSKPSPVATAAARPAVFWPIVGVVTLVLCFGTYLVVRRFMARPAPPPAIVRTEPPAPAAEPPPAAPARPLTQDIVAGYVEAANYAIDDKDYEAARYDVDAALELDPNNQDLLAKRKQIEDLSSTPAPPPPRPKPAPVPDVQETPGIPRRANEAAGDYAARVGRIQTNMREGNRALEQDEFALALTRYQAVVRDQPGYQNVDGQIADAAAKQKRQVDAAIENGQQNERAGRLVIAVQWYDRALKIDPNSAAAQERLAAVADRRTKDGLAAFARAEVFRKRNEIPRAVAAYQEAADLLPASNDKKAEAQQWLEKLKQ
jgi:pSer/pThr/pTyr-binding forkhead associated (FHA) protein